MGKVRIYTPDFYRTYSIVTQICVARTLHMLEDGLDLAILSSVLEDLCASCLLLASPHEAPSIALRRRQEPLPAPREGTHLQGAGLIHR